MRAAITKYHGLGGFNNRKFFFSEFWRLGPAWSSFGEGPPPGLNHLTVFSDGRETKERERKKRECKLVSLLIRALIPLGRLHPHDLI